MAGKNNETLRGRPPLPDSERADAQIQLRVTSKRKASYVRAANRKKQTLAAWMFEVCDAAAVQPFTDRPAQLEFVWGYAHNGGGLAVMHAVTTDDRLNALCGAKGPFYPRAAGSARVCSHCRFKAGEEPEIETR